ncbi:MAG: hypothetical protein ABI140_01545 [Jatrophihabitantaceae bacterium]
MIGGLIPLLIMLGLAAYGLAGRCADTCDLTFSLWPLGGVTGDDPRAIAMPRPLWQGWPRHENTRPQASVDRHEPYPAEPAARGDQTDEGAALR